MKLYKLTDSEGYTRKDKEGETKWEIGKTVTVSIPGTTLCTNEVIHCYKSLLLAELLNPIHANFPETKRAWMCEGTIVSEDGTKVGVKSLTILEECTLPQITLTQKIIFGILAAKEVCKEETWNKWADNWLNKVDRSVAAAYAAYAAAAYSAYAYAAANTYIAATNAAYAAYAAATNAAYAAATNAAYVAATIAATNAAANATIAATNAAANAYINLQLIAEKAMLLN